MHTALNLQADDQGRRSRHARPVAGEDETGSMNRNPIQSLALLGAALCCAAACERPEPVAEVAELGSGYWTASISLPGDTIDTGLELNRSGDSWQANLINGQERVRIDQVTVSGDKLLLRFPAFNNEIKATLVDGKLLGTLTLVKRFGEIQVMPFEAVPGLQAPEPAEAPAPAVDLSGRWAVRFTNEDGTDSPSIGEFAQRGSRLFGTFLNPNGDHRFLAGFVSGSKFKLSTFDGAHAFIFSGEVTDGAIVNAGFWSGTSFHQSWSATRNENVELPDAYSRTYLKPGYERLEFEFPNEDGVPVSIDDEKFAGKVVLVMLGGSWCPNCNDEARFMAPLYAQYRDQGLEVIALMYEHFDDRELAVAQVGELRRKFDIEYEMLIAGISDKTEAAKTLPSLSAVLAFPTTIFIDRSGRVRKIHTGFSGPGTGEHHERLREEMTSIVRELLAEPEDLIETLTSDDNSPVEE